MAKHAVLPIPFVEARHVGKKQKPTAIVLDLSATTSEKGAALGIAMYHHSINAPSESHHYIVDEAETYRCVPDNVSAYRSPYRALSVLICAQPHEYEPLWEDATAALVLYRAAELVASLLSTYKIPVRYLDADDEQKWINHSWRRRGGLIVQAIGTWPYESFLNDVEGNLNAKS
jgi:hypothetical protein